ncbi:MAG: ABC transporter substrate-binding protein [bacterium]|nr:ABC transporter substrate-binding protein [bacterium]MDZ4284404.1 ABC transporter substrate-binding protein [Patescibacteria group bacterium]
MRTGTFSIAPLAYLERLRKNFSPLERVCFWVFALLLAGTSLLALGRLNEVLLEEIPARGGTLREGLIGTPRFINPLFALSEPERDLTALLYAGLLKPLPDGSLAPELAESYEISNDNLSYTVTIREDARFHDGSSVRAEDVVFTVAAAQDSRLKSPKRGSWEGVQVEALDERHVRFTLAKPYAPFPEALTLGILPARLWREFDPDTFLFSTLMSEPVGAGPFRLRRIDRDRNGVPKSYTLEGFEDYALGTPYLETIKFLFYPNEAALLDAYTAGDVDTLTSVPPFYAERLAASGVRIELSTLPRLFAVFLNQNRSPVFSEAAVRRALAAAIDKTALIERVLRGYGSPAEGPIPPGLLASLADEVEPHRSASDGERGADRSERMARRAPDEHLAEAREILERAGWKQNTQTNALEKRIGKETKTLAFTLATADSAELKAAALYIKEVWERLGISVTLAVFDMSALQHDVIRPREYDALLFGEVIGRDLDLYPFWHSSQRADPGLNVALYTNLTADKLLEEARTVSANTERIKRYRALEREVEEDLPAIFLYAPEFIYVVPERLGGLELGVMTVASERFLKVKDWYVEREKVWPFFNKAQ